MGQAETQQCQLPKHSDKPSPSVAGDPNVDHAPLPVHKTGAPFQKKKILHKNHGIGFDSSILINHDIVLGTKDFKRYFSDLFSFESLQF